jgi:threonine synthase
MTNNSYFQSLECAECDGLFPTDEVQTFCEACQSPLLSIYDLESASRHLDRDQLVQRTHDMWRWHELLPVLDQKNIVSLGEGDTPLLRTDRLGEYLGLRKLYVKDESQNPTGTFKARGLAAAVSKAKELGIAKLIIPTAGNAGGALASYAARGGMKAAVVMPNDTPVANIVESRIAGADVELVEGLISDAARLVKDKVNREGWFDMSTFKEPYRVEGKKIMGYEVAEGFGWKLPDVIVYPTGGGTGLIGMWKAFRELEALGWLESSEFPRMVVVQAEGCAPVIKAFNNKKPACEFWEFAQTIATGLRVPRSFADRLIMKTLYESNGTAVAVADEDIRRAQEHLANLEGVFAAPEGAATLAGLEHLVRDGWVHPDESVVLFNTGSGLKYLN